MASPSGNPSPTTAQEPAIEWERKPRTIDANLNDYDAIAATFNW